MKRCTWKVSENKTVELDLLRRFPGTVFCLDVQLNLKRGIFDHTPNGMVLLALFGWKIIELGFSDGRHLEDTRETRA
jgi:hypothetical protein